MPGHGDPILQTFDQWIVRVNRRLQRLERRQARSGGGALTGQVTLWVDDPSVPVPDGWVALDGATYPQAQYPRLARLLGAGATVTVPDVPAPSGLVHIMRV